MRTEIFKNYIGSVNEIAMSKVLGVPRNFSDCRGKGIDLIDSDKGVEVKGCLIYPESSEYKKNYLKWTLFDQEIDWHEKYDLSLYCAIGSYTLSRSIKDMVHRDMESLEFFVAGREFWVVPWDWTLNFPVKNGKYHNYRYLRRKPASYTGIPAMPKTTDTFKINKGLLHFTAGVDASVFDLNLL